MQAATDLRESICLMFIDTRASLLDYAVCIGLFLFYFFSLKVMCFEYKLVVEFCLAKLVHTTACMNNKGVFLQFKYMHTREITVHANVCDYKNSKFYM